MLLCSDGGEPTGQNNFRPFCIDNTDLQGENVSDVADSLLPSLLSRLCCCWQFPGELKMNIQENTDYALLPESVWNELSDW
jgi:hypothetical protein